MNVRPPRSSFSARCPVSATISPRSGHGPEQARYAEEAFVLGLRPEFAQDRQPRVAAVADDVVVLAGPAGDGGAASRPRSRMDALISS
jgi:hypothetical protein